jgi:hypothetical protein
LKSTLEGLIDFDRINSREMRFSVGAVNVRTGNLVYFDNATHRLRPEHAMASGALPPGFPTSRSTASSIGMGARSEYTAQLGDGQRSPAGHVGLSGRSLERARQLSRQPRRGGNPSKGNPVFEPNARQH